MRPILSYTKVQKLVSSIRRNRRFLNAVPAGHPPLLNLGCGPNIKKRYVNLDYHWRPGIDICWDLARGIPCKDSIFSGIFTEHCLEHIPLDACIFLLSECYRVLNQGVLRVIVPDAELYINAYVSRREHAFQAPYYDINDDEFTPLMAINRVFRNFGHRYAYDYETIEILLEKAGFKEIRRRSFLVGSDSRLLIDSESRSVESLYVEAVKN